MADKPASEAYYAGAYWGPRRESPEECARRTAAFLSLLAPCDSFLSHWYMPARSPKAAREHSLMPPDVPTLTEMFRRGVNRERGGPAVEQLGFRFWFDNGGSEGDCAELRITCGGYSDAVPNSCVMTLPKRGPHADRLLSAPVLTGVVRGMALAWEPDWALATSWEHRELLTEEGRTGTFVGWITYLSRRRGSMPPLPAPVRVEPVEDRGTLVILTPERLTAKQPEHVDQGRYVGELLARAGLMQPVMP